MNQGDRAWHYSTGPKGVVRRVALVVGMFDSSDERVNLWVYPEDSKDVAYSTGSGTTDAVPVRYVYAEGAPVSSSFCTPMLTPTVSPTAPKPIKVARPVQTR